MQFCAIKSPRSQLAELRLVGCLSYLTFYYGSERECEKVTLFEYINIINFNTQRKKKNYESITCKLVKSLNFISPCADLYSYEQGECA